jgi:hypothetical protein
MVFNTQAARFPFKSNWRWIVNQLPVPRSCDWDSHQEERRFHELEEIFSRELLPQKDFPRIVASYPSRLAELMGELPPGYSENFIVDVVSACSCLCLRTWRDYVNATWENSNPDTLLTHFSRLPRLESFLSALGLDGSIVRKIPSLAREDLVARNFYADGGRAEDYLKDFGCKIQPQDSGLFVTPISPPDGSTGIDAGLESEVFNGASERTFKLCQQVSIGRQRKSESLAYGVIYGARQHRLVIANKDDARTSSREQILISQLTPQVIYIKNTSDHFPIEISTLRDTWSLDVGQSCLSIADFRVRFNQCRLRVISSQVMKGR